MNEATLNHQSNEPLNKAIGYSVAFHVVLIAFVTLRAVFYPSEPLILENSIRVDIVSLPDKQAATLPPPPAAEEVKPETKPEPEPKVETKPEAKPETKPEPKPVAPPKPEAPKVDLNKSKKDQESALKRLEAMQKLEKMMKKDEGAKSATSTSASKPAVVKGNEVSKGNSLTGTMRLDHKNYLGSLESHVKRHWNLPQWLANANLKARVLVFVDARGFVLKKQITQSSNNQDFDERALRAIEEASPLPPPPSNLVNLFAVDGVELGFPE